MCITSIIFIAFGLAMDAFAVSISSGLTIKYLRIADALKIALFFGLFQAIMPIIGWSAGLSFRDYISSIDHWIAFTLLSIIGLKIIYESLKIEGKRQKLNPLNIYVLLMLSIATSIDALAVGLSFSCLRSSIILPSIIIGSITFLLSIFGVYFGNRFGNNLKKKVEIIGGLILIGIGIKILIEHLT